MHTIEQLALPFNISDGDHGAYVVTGTTIKFPEGTQQSQWEEITRQLADLFAHTAVAHVRVGFLLGDALNYGERNWNEEAAQAIDATRKQMQLSIKTIENFAWIAGSISPENRHELLTMAHHEAVARLEPSQQRELLDKAQEEALSVAGLRKEVRAIAPSRPRKIKAKKSKDKDDIVTMEKAVEAAAILTEYAIPFHGRKASELTPAMRKAFDEYMPPLYAFSRRFTRKEGW